MTDDKLHSPPTVTESTDLSVLSTDLTRGLGDLFSRAESLVAFDYTSLDVDKLHQLYSVSQDTHIQLGTGFFAPICQLATIAEMGIGFKVQVMNADDNPEPELTKMVNGILQQNRAILTEACLEKAITGVSYLTMTPTRKLESLSSKFVEIDRDSFDTSRVVMARIRQVVRRYDSKSQAYVDVNVTREYTEKTILYEAKCESASGFNQKVSIPNTLKLIPFVDYNNVRLPGYQFGQSEFLNAIPYAATFAAVLERGRQSQSYHGQPILQITDIQGSAKAWLLENLGINFDTDTQAQMDTKLLAFLKRNKIFIFGQNAKGSFIESRYPIGATEELVKILTRLISTASMTPEFMFGYSIDSANASIREQHVPFQMKIQFKRMYFEQMISNLVRTILYMYSSSYKIDKNRNAEAIIPNFDVEAWDRGEYYTKVTFKPFLTSDGKLQLDVLKMLRESGVLSATTLMKAYEEYIDDPETELSAVLADKTLQMQQKSTDSASDTQQKDRARKDPSSAGDNSGGNV